MEVNHLGEVSGKPQGKNFYMKDPSLVGADGQKLSNDKRLDLMKKEANIKSDEDYQKEIDDITDYNEKLKEVFPVSIKLNGNAVLIRLYKHYTVKKTGTSLFTPNRLVIPYETPGGKWETKDSPLQFVNRGVIYMVSDQCSEPFKNKFKVGDIIDLKFGINLMQQRTWLNTEDFYESRFDNWFNINENMIEKGII